MDIQPRVTSDIGQHDYDWLDSRFGTEDPETVTLDLSKFTEATHYPDGFIRAGGPITKDGTTGLYGPAAEADTTCDGHLYQNVQVNSGATKAGAPMLWHGVVRSARVPYAAGALAPHFRYV